MASGFAVGWRQVGACLMLACSAAIITSTYSIIAAPLAAEFQPSRMMLMLSITIMSAVSGVASPWFGSLMDRMSMRRLTLIGSILLTGGYVALSFVTSIMQVWFIFGLFMAPAIILIGPMAASVLLPRWFVRRRGTAIGIAVAGVSIGTFLYAPLIQGLLDALDWRTALRVLALIIFLATVPFAALIVNHPAERGLHPDGADHAPEEVDSGVHAASTISARVVLADPTFWIIAGMFAIGMSGMAGMVTNLVPLATDVGVSPSSAALLISVFAMGGLMAKFAFAAFADRVSLRVQMFAALGGFATGMALLTQAEGGYWVIATGIVVIGLFGGIFVPLQGMLVPRVFGQKVVGRVFGLINVVVLAWMLVSPPLFGLIFDVTGNYDAVFLTFVVLAVIVALCVPLARLHPKDQPVGVPLPA